MELLNKLISKRTQGSLYEQKARAYLEAQGLHFIAANQSFKCGELDLIMQQGETLVFLRSKASITVSNKNGLMQPICG